jgi:putative endonuclease
VFYIYILYSISSDKYYVGYTNDFRRRLLEHNTSERDTYTSKHRPWLIKAVFECGLVESNAMKTERFIKKQKSRKFIERLCDSSFILTGSLAQLLRVF